MYDDTKKNYIFFLQNLINAYFQSIFLNKLNQNEVHRQVHISLSMFQSLIHFLNFISVNVKNSQNHEDAKKQKNFNSFQTDCGSTHFWQKTKAHPIFPQDSWMEKVIVFQIKTIPFQLLSHLASCKF